MLKIHQTFSCLLAFSTNQNFHTQKQSSPQLEMLLHSRQNALTFNAFKRVIISDYNQFKVSDYQYKKNILDIRNIISRQYSTRYLNILDGTIVTGIRGLNYYDHLAKDTFLTNIMLYSLILKPLFNIAKEDYKEIIQICVNNEFEVLHSLIHWITLGLKQITQGNIDRAVAILNLTLHYIN